MARRRVQHWMRRLSGARDGLAAAFGAVSTLAAMVGCQQEVDLLPAAETGSTAPDGVGGAEDAIVSGFAVGGGAIVFGPGGSGIGTAGVAGTGFDVSPAVPTAGRCTVLELADTEGLLVFPGASDGSPVRWARAPGSCLRVSVDPRLEPQLATLRAAFTAWQEDCAELCLEASLGPDPGVSADADPPLHIRVAQTSSPDAVAETQLFFDVDSGLAQFAYITLASADIGLSSAEWTALLGEVLGFAPGAAEPAMEQLRLLCELYGPGSSCQPL